MGATVLITFMLGDKVCNAIGERGAVPKPGETVRLCAQLGHMHLIDTRTGRVVPVAREARFESSQAKVSAL